MKKFKNVLILTGGGGPAEPTAERHPQCDPCEKLTIAVKQSELAYNVKSNAKGGEPAGFTMAEILLSLTIIGVVAAITLPSLTGNINERTWNTQRKALYARFSQAIALMPALNGYGTLRETTDSAGSTSIEDTAAETFITNGLAKVLKINNICDSEHLEDCGITSNITTLNASKISTPATMKELNSLMTYQSFAAAGFEYSQIDTKAAAFETQNGESIITFYNPNCINELQNSRWADAMQPKICANFVYDLNGNKGPNTVGKDIGFITAFYSTDSVLAAPYPAVRDAQNAAFSPVGSGLSASQSCTNYDSEYRLPTQEEAAAMFVNKELIGNFSQAYYWTSSLAYTSSDGVKAWAQSLISGNRIIYDKTNTASIRCVKR